MNVHPVENIYNRRNYYNKYSENVEKNIRGFVTVVAVRRVVTGMTRGTLLTESLPMTNVR